MASTVEQAEDAMAKPKTRATRAKKESNPTTVTEKKKATTAATRKKKDENDEPAAVAIDGVAEPVNEKPDVAVAKPTRGRKKKEEVVKVEVAEEEPENEDDVNDAEEAEVKKKKAPASKTRSEDQAKADNSPMAGSAVARCFGNVVAAADVKIEAQRLKAAFAADPAKSAADFQVCLNRILAQYKSTNQLNFCSDLVQQFVSSQSEEYQAKFLVKLLGNLKVKEKAVRLRSVHLVRLWLKAQTKIAEDIHVRLIDGLLESAYDKNPLVRQEVMAALEFLQDPNNEEDRVLRTLCLAAEHDPVAKVRKVALRVVSSTVRSIPTFVARTRDESDEVRLACWRELEDRFQLQWFSSEQLMEMFDQGLEDFSAPCRAQAERTLMKWFAQEKQSDILSFLDCFDVEADEILVLRVLDVLAPKYPKDKIAALSPAMSLSKSASIWLRYCCERKFEELDVSASALMEGFSQILQVMRYSKRDSPENYFSCAFIAKQLVLAVSFLEMIHDPIGRGNVVRILSEALLVDDFPEQLVDPMVKALKRCFVDDSQFIVEITTNVLSFLSELSPLDQVRADIMKAEQLIDDYTRAKNYASLPTLVAEIETLKEKEKALVQEREKEGEAGLSTTPTFSRLVRSTALVCSILRLIPRQNKDSLLSGLLDTCCVPALQSPEVEARMYGVETLGLLALRDLSIAKSHGILLARTFFENEREDMQVRLKALQVLFDLLTAFGKDVCLSDGAEAGSSKDFDLLIQYLMALLEIHRDPEIRYVAANGLTKLLFLGRVAYPGLVQCLLIVLFHPSSDLQPKLKQCMLTFFAEYKHSRVVLQAAEPLIEAIIQPAEESMCEDLPFDKVLERLCFLLRDQMDLQLDFGLILVSKIAKYRFEEPAVVKTMVKLLTSMSLVPVTEEGALEDKLKRLHYSVELAIRAKWLSGDKVSSKQMDKFAVILGKLDKTPNNENELPETVRMEIDALLMKETGDAEGIAHSRPKRAATGKQHLKDAGDDDEDDEDGSDSDDE